MRIGLSGTGRIGRLFIRRMIQEDCPDAELIAVNTTAPAATLAHLLKYDSVHGMWNADIVAGENELVIDGRRVALLSERNPRRLPWRECGVETAVDATGKFNDRAGASGHLAAGASRVVLTAPAAGADFTMLMGVNERLYDPSRHSIISAASCTTNCLAPLLALFDEAAGIERGWMTTVHAFTGDQNHTDNPHRDLRRARSCVNAIVPTSTGVGKALRDILPHLADRLQGISIRVPVADVSLLDLQLELRSPADAADIRAMLQHAAQGTMRGIVDYTELPLVSADYIGNPHSAIVDGQSIMTMGNQVKLLAWYDNEWGYTCRVADAVRCMAAHKQAVGEATYLRGECSS